MDEEGEELSKKLFACPKQAHSPSLGAVQEGCGKACLVNCT